MNRARTTRPGQPSSNNRAPRNSLGFGSGALAGAGALMIFPNLLGGIFGSGGGGAGGGGGGVGDIISLIPVMMVGGGLLYAYSIFKK
jgi:hypothetical protein